jgi:hypothetical protein
MPEVLIYSFHHWLVNGKSWFWDGGTPFYARLRAMGYHQAHVVGTLGFDKPKDYGVVNY